MIYEILKRIKNFFPDLEHQMAGEFKIEAGVITPCPELKTNQYLLIEGSSLNDGVYKDLATLEDETFTGVVTPLKIPKEFLALVTEIEAYQSNQSAGAFQSESFGGYSYSRATNSSGQLAGWAEAFATRLNAWRKL